MWRHFLWANEKFYIWFISFLFGWWFLCLKTLCDRFGMYETGVGMIMESNKHYTTIINWLSCTCQEGYRVNQTNVPLMEEILHHLRCITDPVNNGISTTNLNWWFPDFWTINIWEMVGVVPLSPCRHEERFVEDLCLEQKWRLGLDRCIHPWKIGVYTPG